jgi:hypothetical protein
MPRLCGTRRIEVLEYSVIYLCETLSQMPPHTRRQGPTIMFIIQFPTCGDSSSAGAGAAGC